MNAAERAGVVLAILREHPGGLTFTGLGEKSGLGARKIADALAKLVRDGVLDVVADPPPRVYTLNANAEGYVPKQRGSFT